MFEKALVSSSACTLLIVPAWGLRHLFLSHPLLFLICAFVPRLIPLPGWLALLGRVTLGLFMLELAIFPFCTLSLQKGPTNALLPRSGSSARWRTLPPRINSRGCVLLMSITWLEPISLRDT